MSKASNLSGFVPSIGPTNNLSVGIITATTFDGNITGVAATFTGDVTGVNATFSSNVTIGGTLTYEDVTNIDSVGLITARTGINVLAGGIDAVGVVTATSFSGDGSALTGVANTGFINAEQVNVVGVVTATSFSGDGSNLSGVESGVANFVASGNISNGDAVVINTDGTVSVTVRSNISTPTAGDPSVFESASVDNVSAVFDSSNDKVVVAYRDVGNSNYGTAVVGNVSGETITFGSPVVFESGNSNWISATFDSSNNKVVIVFSDDGDSGKGKAVVGTVSGTSISFGSAVQFESGGASHISATFDSSNNKVVIAYRDENSSNYGTAIIGTVSGTSISFVSNSAVIFHTQDTRFISATFDSSNNKVVIAYKEYNFPSSEVGKAIVGTVSGSSISFGTAVTFESVQADTISAVFDSSNNKVVVAYRDVGNSNYGTAIVGTVSGTSISFGTEVVFNSANSKNISAVYDSTSSRVVIAYIDDGNSNYRTSILGTVSGTSISFGSEYVFNTATSSSNDISVTHDSAEERVVITYADGNSSNFGTAVALRTTSTNLTDENYIGIAAEAISNSATGKITIAGGTNTSQTGLTVAKKQYVQNNGSGISTISSNPSVVAGTSISATSIIVKG